MSKHFQQTDFWCDFKCAHGWNKISFNEINILTRTFKKGPVNFSLAYIPLAPEYNSLDYSSYFECVSEFVKKLKPLLPKNTLCVRFDFPIDFSDTSERDFFVKGISKYTKKLNIKKSNVDIQPPDSTYIDLFLSQDEILSSMKSKWRYNIRYASKHGVNVRRSSFADSTFQKDLESFYNLYKITSQRDGIGIHPISYYEDLLRRGSLNNDNKVFLYIASHDDEDLAAIITLFSKDEAIYLYGCSGNNKRNLMPAYLVQWTAICDAKEYGSKIYDFYGIPPTDNENHPMHGLYLFKTGFGGKKIHRIGSFDIPLSFAYRLYIFAENIRAFWHKKIMKKIRGR